MAALDFVLGTDAEHLPIGTAASEFPSGALSGVNVIAFFSPVLVKVVGVVGETSKVRDVAEIHLILTPQQESL